MGIHRSPVIDLTDRESRPTVVFVGRLAANKRPDHAVEAFARVLERIPDAQMWVIGSGAMNNELRRAAPPNVEFFGNVSNERKYELMARADVLVVTSVREGWGLVVDEAASVGTPTIGYDVDGLRDSVMAADGTLVVPHPESLAAAVTRHLARIGRRHRPALIERETLGWDHVAEEVFSLMSDMSGTNQPTRSGAARELVAAGASGP